jgi:hypothetical protein
VQVVRFEAAAEVPPGSPLAQLDHTVVALVVAEDCAYTFQLEGPEAHARELGDVADASLRSLHASPARGSPAYRGGLSAVRLGAMAFLACVAVAALVLVVRRARRGHNMP